MEEECQRLLLLMGATKDGKKELIAMTDGHRESAESWRGLILDVKRRGLSVEPKLAVGDGGLGFWRALREVFPNTTEQRCWVHKTANVLDKLPRGERPKAKRMVHDIRQADTREEANAAFDAFVEDYQPKHPKAVESLVKARDELLAFYDFPAEHWPYVRTTTTTTIESTFVTIRLRHKRTKGCGSRTASQTMMLKLAESASRRWRALNGSQLLPDVLRGNPFQHGLPLQEAAA